MNPKAKRIIRSVKYFFIFVILAAVFTGVIVLISPEQYGDINRIFATSPDSVPGEALFSYGSWWKMLLIFVIIAAI